MVDPAFPRPKPCRPGIELRLKDRKPRYWPIPMALHNDEPTLIDRLGRD